MMKLGSETGSLVNHIMSRGVDCQPEVGMGVTVLHWTDRSAHTIVEVAKNHIVIVEDHAKRTDDNGMSDNQDYEYTPDPDGRRLIVKRVTHGRNKGRYKTASGNYVIIGARDKYHDYSF